MKTSALHGRPTVTPLTQTVRTLWDNARGHRGVVACGFPATCEDPAAEAALAFPLATPPTSTHSSKPGNGLRPTSPRGSCTSPPLRALRHRRHSLSVAFCAAVSLRRWATSSGSSHHPKWKPCRGTLINVLPTQRAPWWALRISHPSSVIS